MLGERIRKSDFALMAVIALGMLLLLGASDAASRTAPDPWSGNVIGACAGLTWALALLGFRWLSRHDASPGESGAAIIAGNGLAFVFCLPLALPVAETTTTDWLVVGYLGVFQVAAAYLCLERGVRRLPAFEVALLLAIDPVATATWAWLVHGEVPSAMAATGCSLILASIILLSLKFESREVAEG